MPRNGWRKLKRESATGWPFTGGIDITTTRRKAADEVAAE